LVIPTYAISIVRKLELLIQFIQKKSRVLFKFRGKMDSSVFKTMLKIVWNIIREKLFQKKLNPYWIVSTIYIGDMLMVSLDEKES